MDELHVTLEELIEATGLPERTLYRRLKALGIEPDRRVNGSGRPKNHYPLPALPQDWQLKVNIHRNEKRLSELKAQGLLDPKLLVRGRGRPRKETSSLPVPVCKDGKAVVPWQPGKDGAGLSLAEQEACNLKAALIAKYRAHYTPYKELWGKLVPAKQSFLSAYNLGERGSLPELYSKIGHVSFETAEAWDLKLKREENNSFCLADRRGKWRKGQRKVSPEQEKILRDIAFVPTQPLIAEITRQARSRFQVEGLPWSKEEISDDTLRRWLEDFRVKNFDQWVFFRQGEKALNDLCLPHVERDYDRIEVGDIAVADGHVLNCRLINPWTGKLQRMCLLPWYDMKSNYVMGWELMPTENVYAYASGLYRACLCLGKKPRVAYLDNSRAARAGFFTKTADLSQSALAGLWQKMLMRVIYAKTYHGESKTVERFFETMAELERAAIFAYVGTSIEKKPAYLKRGEPIHRALREVATGGREPTIEDFHWALATWLDDYHERPQDGHLKGKCPREVFEAGRGPGFGADEARDLRFLMMPAEVKRINRDGIKLPWSEERYYHPDLYGRQMQTAVIRYDWIDKDQIWVYDEQGNFICEATRKVRVHPAARQLGSPEDVEELSKQLEIQGHLKKQTTGPAREFLKEHMIPEIHRQLEDAGLKASEAAEGYGGKRLKLIKGAAKPTGFPAPAPLTEEGAARIDADYRMRQAEADADKAARADVVDVEFAEVPACEPEAAREPTIWELLPQMAEMDRYEKLIELDVKGEAIPSGELAWMSYYEKTSEFRVLKDYFEEHKKKMVLMYGEDMGRAEEGHVRDVRE